MGDQRRNDDAVGCVHGWGGFASPEGAPAGLADSVVGASVTPKSGGGSSAGAGGALPVYTARSTTPIGYCVTMEAIIRMVPRLASTSPGELLFREPFHPGASVVSSVVSVLSLPRMNAAPTSARIIPVANPTCRVQTRDSSRMFAWR